ncbi:FMP42, partial [Symbiodinium natans]
MELRQPIAVVVTAALSCLLTGGLAFGFSALIPRLERDGAFREDCHEKHPCHAQRMHLIWVFTAGISASGLSTLPQGILIDSLGPKASGLAFGTAVAVGCALFSLGGLWEHAYITGFVLLAVGGSGVYVSALSFGNLFPRHAGFVAAIFVGCFDASMVIFQVLSLLISLGLRVSTIFRAYALLSALLAAAAGLLWPAAPVAGKNRESHEEPEGDGFWSKLQSLDFVLFAFTVIVDVLCVNFFLATVWPRLRSVAPDDAKMLNSSLAVLLPAGAILFVPLLGYLLGQLGPAAGFLALN